ncbi:hypothetical protein JYU34_018576 [Plutella xylostella]|uniref:Uncharacterized protein n=1 Tax=Plutella xylostella TaxID=51655 RepID=A0ABQ7Q1Q3_PLUXY|nr:hypothetical protein JYU34_018576 [Plutella xylostella]
MDMLVALGLLAFRKMAKLRMHQLLVLALAVGGSAGAAGCGGHLQGPHGVIQTPNFPDAFPVPIRCKWVISHATPNGTISIYFTQQYTTTGLTFTEYMYYDDSYKLGERKAFTVTEENITKVKRIQVQSPVLVVELALDALEGSALRALRLLTVFGFNMTYAVTSPASKEVQSCSALDCRLLGHCYAASDYQGFFCSCFEGYSGADCGAGPACRDAGICRHGGTCRQMGPEAVSCVCAPGYTGDFCETLLYTPVCSAEECSPGCVNKSSCSCNSGNSETSLARYEVELQVINEAAKNISRDISNQITEYLKASDIELDEEVEILNISSPDGTGTRAVRARMWAEQAAADSLQAALSFYSAAPRARVLPATLHVDMTPALSFLTLTLNQRREIWEGSEFALTCTAYGSLDVTFTWYKDGVKINFNGTSRNIWTKTLIEDETGHVTSILQVSPAEHVDSGRWSCAADDVGRRRCRALWLTVLRPPDIRLIPSALTVNKGDNVSIMCLTDARKDHGTLGFSWARDRTLFRLSPGREVWEDLYPAGSVLKLYNVQKSGEYRCQVTSKAGTNSKAVTLWALSPQDEFCEAEISHGHNWLRTAPGAHAVAQCPKGYSGQITRFCEPKTNQHGLKWKLPDFSQCVAVSLKGIMEEFKLISRGYSLKRVVNVTRRYENALLALTIHPGEGAVVLHHTVQMLQYLLSKAASGSDKSGSVEYLLRIYDTLLKYPDTFLDEEKVYELQNSIVQTAGMKENLELNLQEFLVISKPARDYNVAVFKLNPSFSANENWLVTSVAVEMVRSTRQATVVAARYNNLAARLPSLKSSIDFVESTEMEYLIASQHIQLSASGEETHTEKDLRGVVKVTVGISGALCLAVTALQMVGLLPNRKDRLPVLLKAATAGTHSAAMFTLLECDTNQEEACPGVWGWVCAACWCAGCAALCAQPLLLQAELAGRPQNAPTVGLLAGVGTLSWLTARLWGGAPLQLGTAAQLVCAAGCILLVILCFSLAICTALRLRSITHKVQVERIKYLKDRRKLVRHTLVLLLTTTAVQAAGVAYAQPGDRQMIHVFVLSAAAIANGIAMVICYVIYDDECMSLARRAFSLTPSRDWEDSPVGDTSLSLYIKQGVEVDSRGGVDILETSSQHLSPMESYWRAPDLGSTDRMHRRQSEPDTRADIVRCVEYAERASRGRPHLQATTTRVVCDLVPRALPVSPPRPPRVLDPPTVSIKQPSPALHDSCSVCSRSNPDVSIPEPKKSSLKKFCLVEYSSTVSLPSMEVKEDKSLDIEKVNEEWNRAYNSPDTEVVLNKISSDLDFLLNRTVDAKSDLDVIEKAPT